MGSNESGWVRKRTDPRLRLALLGGISLIAWGIVLGRAPEAQAQQVINGYNPATVNSNGSGIFVNPDALLTGSPGISNGTPTGSIYSDGTILSDSYGIYNDSTIGFLTNDTGGTISGHSDGIYSTSGSISSLTNSGLILGAGTNARGVQNQGGTIGVLTNSGTITGTGGIAAQTGIGTIFNEDGGTISAKGSDEGIYVNAHVELLDNEAGGTISSASGTAIVVQSHAISTLTNNGLITGLIGITNDGGTIGALVNQLYGTIYGANYGIINDDHIGTLTNSGTIAGGYGIGNGFDATLGTLINSNLISGGTIGIFNEAYTTETASQGSIGMLSNSGDIKADTALFNEGHIGTLDNTGYGLIGGVQYGIANSYGGTIMPTIGYLSNATGAAITAYTTGIYNRGHIGTLTNNGYISAQYHAIANFSGTIGTLINGVGAEISAAYTGIYNNGVIHTLTNSGGINAGYGIVNDDGGTIDSLGNETGGLISADSSGIDNYGLIHTLTNSGLITAGVSGIYNNGQIDTLTNYGTIYAEYGIGNGTLGGIGAFLNTGTILATNFGLASSGSIGAITNSGTIYGMDEAGIVNGETIAGEGYIGTLTNLSTGTIAGYEAGVGNAGTIVDFTNSGLIEATATDASTISGIANIGTIDTLTNQDGGTIYGYYAGIFNGYVGTIGGTIGALTNAGGTISGYSYGIYNNGTIAGLTNSGLIESTSEYDDYNIGTLTGIYNDGAIGTLTNQAGGTISGFYTGIYNDGEGTIATLTNQAHGTITGGSAGIYNAGGITDLTNTGVIGSAFSDAGVFNEGTIGALTNEDGGTITASYVGIVNEGGITALTNSGLIGSASSVEGLSNNDGGTIGALTNEAGGTITGYYVGILNAATITDFTNSGLITSTSDEVEDDEEPEGVLNYGTIGALTNQAGGTITGDLAGLYNFDVGTISEVSNAGTISGGEYGILNFGEAYYDDEDTLVESVEPTIVAVQAAIGTLTNSKVISGGSTGILNGGSIGSLINTGAITGGDVGIYNGLYNYNEDDSNAARAQAFFTTTGYGTGTITNLTNNGIISGGTAGIYNEGYIGSISNSGIISGGDYGIYNGTIAAAIDETTSAIRNQETTATSATATATIGQITNTGTIMGLTGIYLTGGGTTITNSGTIASTDGGNAIYFGGVDDLILTTGSVIDGTIAGGGTASQIALEGDGSLDTTIADFGAGSNLAITPGADWTATGSWTIADVTNDGVFQPGRLGTPLALTGDYLQNADGTMRVLVTPTTSTAFNITGTATLAGTVSYVLAPGKYSPHVYPYLTATDGVTGEFTTVNYGEIPKGLAATQYISDPTVELVLTGPFTIPAIINPNDSSIFSAQTQALAQEADADTGSLLEKAAFGGAATSPACAAEAPLSPEKTGAAGTSAALASTLASVFCGAGGWVEATGSLGHADPSGGAPSYNANTAGFLAGVDTVLDPAGTRLGFAVGYDETYLSDKLGGGGRMGTTRVALYGAQPVGMFTLAGVLEYGNANNTTSRDSGAGNLSESNSVSIWSGGLQLSTQMTMHGIDFLPAAGLRVASVGGGSHFAEGANGIEAAFAVSGKTTQYNSVQPYVLVEGKQNFYTASGITVTPDAEIGLEYEADTHGIVTTLKGADGTVFYTPHNDLDPADALLSAGIAAGKNNWSLFATYTAHVSGNWDTQIGEAGLRITF